MGLDEGTGNFQSTVEVQRPEYRLADISEDGGILSTTGLHLAAAKSNGGAEIKVASYFGAGLIAHQGSEAARKLALAGIGNASMSIWLTTSAAPGRRGTRDAGSWRQGCSTRLRGSALSGSGDGRQRCGQRDARVQRSRRRRRS